MNHYVNRRIHEVIDLVAKAKTRDEKISLLKQHETQALKDVLVGTYDSRVEWNLPEGKPPFEPAVEGSVPSNLLKRTNQFNYFIKGGTGDTLPAFKREGIFISLIEQVHPADTEIVLKMVSKKPLAKGLTKKLIEEAFPGLVY